MKKLFHLGMLALFTITVSSCSKSANDLSPNRQKNEVNNVSSKFRNPSGGLLNGYAAASSWAESKFYPQIHQPYDLALGDPDNSVLNIEGYEFVAVFVVVSYNINEVPIDAAQLTAVNNVTGELVGKYQLLPGAEASNFGVKMSEELDAQFTYFGVIPMSDLANHIKNTVSLYSDITSAEGTTITAILENAFLVMP